MTSYQDIGNALAQSFLDRLSDAVDVLGVPAPAWLGQVGGVGPPTVDACNGLLWVRVASMYPTAGDGQQMTNTRWDSHVPAWVVAMEVGHLWCHQVIEEDGSSPDMAEWQDCATRDGQYRMVLLKAVDEFRDDATGPLRQAIMGQTVSPWTPVGPEGGYSGGLIVVNTIVSSAALCVD